MLKQEASSLLNGQPGPEYKSIKLYQDHPDMKLAKLASVKPGLNELDDWHQLKFGNMVVPKTPMDRRARMRSMMDAYKL